MSNTFSQTMSKEKRFCIYAIRGKLCDRDTCPYIHDINDIQREYCPFLKCRLVDIDCPGWYVNVCSRNVCKFWHEQETPESYLRRIYEKYDFIKRIHSKFLNKNSNEPLESISGKLCPKFLKGVDCEKKNKCIFRHSIEDMQKTPCPNADLCQNTEFHKDSKLYFNIGEKVCRGWHPEETSENYLSRLRCKLI
jgi:hypothetical protein